MSSTWGIAAHFNPANFSLPRENFRKFAAGVRRQGLKLLVLEVAFGDQGFCFDASIADDLVQLRSDSYLWHKERLFALALERLPHDCDAVVWLDGDVRFENDRWVSETRSALERHRVVQPFAHAVWLRPGVDSMPIEDTTYPEKSTEGGRLHSFGFGWTHFGPHALEAEVLHGHPGFAWAARRSLLEDIGFYDRAIAGSGDMLMAHGFVGCDTFLGRPDAVYSEAMLRDYRTWAERAVRAVDGDIGYVEGHLFHLWHGASSKRQHGKRLEGLQALDFDPAKDLRLTDTGLYEVRDHKPVLASFVRDLFSHREEDSVPVGMLDCDFGSGFYEDEGGFRWCRATGVATVRRDIARWRFQLRNNALRRFQRDQVIRIRRNGESVAEVTLTDNKPREVELEGLRAGDRLMLESDFEFAPSVLGKEDARRLSFMFIPGMAHTDRVDEQSG